MDCPSCGAAIADNALRCEFCNRPVAASTDRRATAPRPQKFHVDEDAGGLHIWWRWFSPAVFFLLPFAIAWNAFLIGWYSMATGDMGGAPFFFRFVFLVFPLAHVAVGVGLAYLVLAMLLNRSVVKVDRGVLTVAHHPLPWPGATLEADQIEQIFCSRVAGKNSDSSPTFQVRARLKNGSVKTLLTNVTDSDEALYLEQAIERHLRIRDVEVTGELPRS